MSEHYSMLPKLGQIKLITCYKLTSGRYDILKIGIHDINDTSLDYNPGHH